MNPLKRLVRITKKGARYSYDRFGEMVGVQLIAAGVKFNGCKDLDRYLTEFRLVGFIEVDADGFVKIADQWYEVENVNAV